jgi:hypothetical protein
VFYFGKKRKLRTSNNPVILLYDTNELIVGTILSTSSKFCFNFNPAFINNGIVSKVIREIIGSTCVAVPDIMTPYAIIGKIHTALDAFFLPKIITRVFLPPALSASKSGNELTNNTREDKTPTTIPPSIGSMVI